MSDESKLVEYRLETFEKWLAGDLPKLRPLDHSRICKEVESVAQQIWNAAYQAGRIDGADAAADKLVEVANWCRTNGLEARARHTDSAARRVRPDHLGELESAAKVLVDDAMEVDKIYCGVKSKHVRALRAVLSNTEETKP